MNSVYTYSNDASLPGQLEMILGNTVYRGLDGWKNLFSGATAVEDAQEILVGLMQEYQTDVTALSEAKAGKELAGIYSKGLETFLKGAGVSDEEMKKVADVLGEKEVANMLMQGEFADITNKIDASSCSNKDELKELMSQYNTSDELSKSISKGLKVFGYGTKTIDLAVVTVDKIYELSCLYTANEYYKKMLQYLESNCYYSVVKEAAHNTLETMEQGADKEWEIVLQTIAGEIAEEWVLDWLVDKGSDFLAKKCLYVKAVETAWNLGADISNYLLHTGDTVKLKDSMRSYAYISNCLGRWTLENMDNFTSATTEEKEEYAQTLMYSVNMLIKSRMLGEKTFQSMRETSFTDWKEDYSVSCLISEVLESQRETLFMDASGELKSALGISCPVNVQIFDKNDNLLLTLYDGVETEGNVGEIDYCVKYNPIEKDYMKFVILPQNGEYYVKAVGQDLGKVDTILTSVDASGKAETLKFTDLLIDKGTSILIEDMSVSDGSQYVIEAAGKTETQTFEKETQETVSVESIKIKNALTEMQVGQRVNLAYDVLPTNAQCKKVVWSTSDEQIASINSDGVITALKEGEVTITAMSNDGTNITTSYKLVVKDEQKNSVNNNSGSLDNSSVTPEINQTGTTQNEAKVTNLSIKAPSKKLAAGKKVKLTLNVTPSNATNQSVTWKSDNTSYATVDANGKVTLKKAGIGKYVTITATANDGSGVSASIKIKIMKHAVKSIKLKAPTKTVKAGKSLKLKTVIKTTGNKANKSLKWTSSNTKYAEVSKTGKVKVKKAGKGKTVKITAMATDGSGKKATIKIKIK